jgi:predicted dehydrogenase
MSPAGVAVIGCGTISDEYLRNLTSFPDLRVLHCADLDPARAKAQAAKYGVPSASTTAAALADPEVEIAVNLTVPAAHARVARDALAAGKHVWIEKPLALEVATGRELLAAARAAGRRIGCAPDTVLGAGLQTARRLIDAGTIGEPRSALVLMQDPGPDRWHPDPEFLFQRGAGPLFDIGPYYLSTLALLFGPAIRVAALGQRGRATRVIGSGPRAGVTFGVDVPTQVAALVGFAAGQAASLLLSFDSPLKRHGFVEITGAEATLALPDPNRFDGQIGLRPTGSDEWTYLPAEGATDGRGLGVLDLARAVRAGRPPRASGELALHVLETMEAIAGSIETGSFEPVGTTFTAVAALAPDWDPHARTLS